MHEALSKCKFEQEVALLTPVFLRSRNWKINEAEYPVLDVTFLGGRALRLQLNCDEWDELPPAAVLLDEAGQLLTQHTTPGGSIFNQSSHPSRPGPFICMRGFREYHTHPSHLSDAWVGYRSQDGNNLVGLLDQVCRAWRKLTANE